MKARMKEFAPLCFLPLCFLPLCFLPLCFLPLCFLPLCFLFEPQCIDRVHSRGFNRWIQSKNNSYERTHPETNENPKHGYIDTCVNENGKDISNADPDRNTDHSSD